MLNREERLAKLENTARRIVKDGKGILAADETEASIGKRFEKYGIENNDENRRKFREIMFTTPDIQDKLGGIILHEETFFQSADNGKPFVDVLIEMGISPGIKLDKGLIDFKYNEKVSVGIEDLEKRLSSGKFSKADFAKWRSVLNITETTPTEDCIHANCDVLARYAGICQKFGIVPIVEPELLWDGSHKIEEAEAISKTILACLNYHLHLYNVYIPGILIKPAFVSSGKDSNIKIDCLDVATRTFNCLYSTIPVGVPGIVFLSGGHKAEDATRFLDFINKDKRQKTWKLSFSYGRALSDPVLEAWSGNDDNIEKAKAVFIKRLDETYKAALGNL